MLATASNTAGIGFPSTVSQGRLYAMTQSLDSDELAILPDDDRGGRLAARRFLAAGAAPGLGVPSALVARESTDPQPP